MAFTFTFAVVGHNESALMARALAQACEAARGGDEVWFVDSESTDGSAAVAERLGVRVLQAPRGKGRAIARALSETSTEYLVTVDGDIERTSANFPLILRQAAERSDADLVVGQFHEPRRRLRRYSTFVMRPLVNALFPEVRQDFGMTPLSGFRALRAAFPLGRLPDRFGVETHTNIAVAAGGGTVEVAELGTYWGPPRMQLDLGRHVGAAVLDLAERFGRIDRRSRPLWDAWVERIVFLVTDAAGPSPDRVAFNDVFTPDLIARLEVAASSPLPGRSP